MVIPSPSEGLALTQWKLKSKYHMSLVKLKDVFGDTVDRNMIKNVQSLLTA